MTTIATHSVTLTAAMLREALEYANPDGPSDTDQEETEVVIEWMPERVSIEGEQMPAGYYLYYSDYPEEGVIGPLGAPKDATDPDKAIEHVRETEHHPV